MDLEAATQGDKNTAENIGLSGMEKDTIGEILNISMGAGATAISTLLGKPVEITTPMVTLVKTREFEVKSLEPAVGIQIEYIEGLHGANLMVMKKKDIRAIVSQLLPDVEEEDDGESLSEMHMSAISEIMNQMMGASSTALSSFLGSAINISTPSEFEITDIQEKVDQEQPYLVSVLFRLKVEGLVDSEFITVMPVAFTKQLVAKALNLGGEEPAETAQEAAAGPEPIPSAPVPEPELSKAPAGPEMPATPPVREASVPQNPAAGQRIPVSVQPLQWQNFNEAAQAELDGSGMENFDLIMDVPLDLSVEIGRTKMQVKEILDLRQGSIVEFDKQADEPVDIFVNGQLIAKGDVVVINDNFGVRITEIIPGRSISGIRTFPNANKLGE